jgi:hypothetical protein
VKTLFWFILVWMVVLSGCDSEDMDGDGFVDCARVVNNWPRSDDARKCGGGPSEGTIDGNEVTHYGGFNVLMHDCDDADPGTNPGAAEACDGFDNNCNGLWDEGAHANDLAVDCDGDGYVWLGLDDGSDDCDPWDAAVHPDSDELDDGFDNNCDGICLDGEPCGDDPEAGCLCRAGVEPAGYQGPVGCACATNSTSGSFLWPVLALVIFWRRQSKLKFGLLIMLLGLVLGSCDAYEPGPKPQLHGDPSDRDGDGYGPPEDCDDANHLFGPEAEDIPGDGIDQNCDGRDATAEPDTDTDADTDADTDSDTDTDVETGHTGETVETGDTGGVIIVDPNDVDDDGDDFTENEGDCDDADPDVNPDEPELCDGLDQDCDLVPDDNVVYSDYCADIDQDGFGDPNAAQNDCLPPAGHVLDCTDCNDADPDINPGEAEICDGLDQNCVGGSDDGLVFSDYCADDDGDGFGDPNDTFNACAPLPNYVLDCGDCDDAEVDINPTEPEVCDGDDQNCDGVADDGLIFTQYYADTDLDGFGDVGEVAVDCQPVPGYILDSTDCDDSNAETYPGTAPNESDPSACYKDDDEDDFGDSYDPTTPDGVTLGTDCHDGDATINPDAPDILYDSVDQDCDGYAWCDGDGDGVDSVLCAAGGTDCDDTDDTVYPGAVEVQYNGLDDDCNPGTPDQPFVDPLCVTVTAPVTGNVDVYLFETNNNNVNYWVDPVAVPVVPNTVPFASGDAAASICGDMSLVPYSSGHTLLVLGTYDSGGEQPLVTGNSMVGYTSYVMEITLSGVPLVCSSFRDALAAPYAYTSCTLP